MPINSQDYEMLINQTRAELVGVSVAGIKSELFNVLTEFFFDSRCWLESIRFNVVTDTVAYDITPDEGQIIGLVGVFNSESQPQKALMPDVGQVILANEPNVAEAPLYYYAVVSKNVKLPVGNDDIPIGPSWVLPQYHLGILDGVVGRLMAQPDRPFSNEKVAAYRLKKFRNAIAQARVRALRQNTLGAQAWRFPQTFATSTQQYGIPGMGGNDRSF